MQRQRLDKLAGAGGRHTLGGWDPSVPACRLGPAQATSALPQSGGGQGGLERVKAALANFIRPSPAALRQAHVDFEKGPAGCTNDK